MAMAKPVIATAVSDLPEIVDGCGVIVEPENVPQLALAIESMVMNQQATEEMARKGREKCVREYSWDAMEHVLNTILQPFL
jgi:glycosyltransferase involved in cell wall biosynthesis